MPAKRIDGMPTQVSEYDVIARDSDRVAEFIDHVGLCLSNYNQISLGSCCVKAAEMVPPLAPEDEKDELENFDVTAMGSASPLTLEERNKIAVFIKEAQQELKGTSAPLQYTVIPHFRPATPQCSKRRFSCAGFVQEAYRYARIMLVKTDDENLPEVTLEDLKRAYPFLDELIERNQHRLLSFIGIVGDGPWHALLPGYIINSLSRQADIIRSHPYLPNQGDCYYPARQSEAHETIVGR